MNFTLPARRLRDARAVFRRLAGPRSAAALSVSFVAGPAGLTLRAERAGVAAEHRVAGEFPPAAFVLPLDALPDVARGDVAFSLDGNEVEVAWSERGVPRSHRRPVTTADAVAPPPLPAGMRRQPAGFLKALAEAAATTDPDSLRYALGRLRLRGGAGGAGQVAATDGAQLLIQGGFDFPWDGDRLVPAPRLLAARELDADAPAEVGAAAGPDGEAESVVIRCGDWTLRLAIDAEGRFPAVDAVVPAEGAAAGAIELSEADRRFLAGILAGLPGADGERSPMTLDLNGQVLVRAQGDGDARPTELELTSSRWTGPATAVATRRGPLARALGLGFGRFDVYGAEEPAVCRDGNRAFVWAVLGKDSVVPAAEDAVRVGSIAGDAATGGRVAATKPSSPHRPRKGLAAADAELRRPAMAATAEADPAAGREVAEGFAELIGRAGRLKGSLRDLLTEVRGLAEGLRRQRRRSRLVRSTLRSLRQLREVEV